MDAPSSMVLITLSYDRVATRIDDSRASRDPTRWRATAIMRAVENRARFPFRADTVRGRGPATHLDVIPQRGEDGRVGGVTHLFPQGFDCTRRRGGEPCLAPVRRLRDPSCVHER